MFYSQLEKSWMDSRVSHDLISLLTTQVCKIVSPLYNNDTNQTNIPRLEDFINLLTRRSRTRTGTVLVALILLTRLSQRLGFVTTTGLASAPQRIFLASLIISTKLIHDTSPKNKHWLTFANGYFELDEINLMEKQFLTLMDFNLSVSDLDFAHVVDRYQQSQMKSFPSNKRKTKSKRWQETTPNRNVALEKTTVTRYSRSSTCSLVSSLSASSSSSSSSSLLTLSLSSTPVLSSSLCDNDMKKSWCYPTNRKSPLFSA